MFPHIDGAHDEEKETLSAKNVYSVNCEIDEICVVINFLRSSDFLWKLSTNHPKCDFNSKHKELNCYFCHVRSSLLRLNVHRIKGPKSLKPYEFISQLFRYEKLRWDWRLKKMILQVSLQIP